MGKNLSFYIGLFFSILTLSFKVIPFIDIQISIAFLFQLMLLKGFRTTHSVVRVFLFLMLLVLFNAITQLYSLKLGEFVKTLILVIFFTIFQLNTFKGEIFVDPNKLKPFLLATLVIVLGFEMIQILEYLLYQTANSFFWFDAISISTAEEVGRFQAVNLLFYMRPVSIYHEPSYLSSVLLVLAITYYELYKSRTYLFFSILGIIGSLSIVGMAFGVIYVAYVIWRQTSKVGRFAFVLLTVFIFALNIGLIYSFIRLDELNQEGTSGWARIIKPLLEVRYEIIEQLHPIGRALGNTRIVYDNSLFVLIAYSGILFPLLAYWLLSNAKLKLHSHFFAFLIGTGNLLFLNGAILTPESSFLLMLLFLVLRTVKMSNA